MDMNVAYEMAFGLMQSGDLKGLRVFLKAGQPPEDVKMLADTDNLRAKVWRRNGTGYVRLLARINHALEGGPTLYRVVNRIQCTFFLPQYDELLDVGTLTMGNGELLLRQMGADMWSAMQALWCVDMSDADRKAAIALVFPQVYLTDQVRKVTFMRKCLGLLFADVRVENRGIKMFEEAMARFERKWQLLEVDTVLAYDGWLGLLQDLADGKPFEPDADDLPMTSGVMALLGGVDPAYARRLLEQAKRVMTGGELRYSYPKS